MPLLQLIVSITDKYANFIENLSKLFLMLKNEANVQYDLILIKSYWKLALR